MKKISILISIITVLILTSCGNIASFSKGDIAILYTNDVHCEVEDGNMSYSSLKALKNEIKDKTDYVTLVDNGDYLQGGFIGSASKGKYIIDIMNEVGYDYITLGNHEFDYGMDELKNRIDEFNGKVLSCNIRYVGEKENKLSSVIPYYIEEYGKTKVAFIGVSTPESTTSSTPANFMEDGEYVYTFFGNTGELNSTVQYYIDEVKDNGADYVVLLTHLGTVESYVEYTSTSLVKNLSGVDVVLDAHSHSVIKGNKAKDKDGNKVIITSTGTKFQNVGLLKIKGNGQITTNLISKYNKEDESVKSKIDSLKAEYNELLKTVIGYTNYDLKITDNAGIRIVRQRETNLGDLISDAYRNLLGADIGIQNGGGIRTNIEKGDITLKNVFDVLPFGNNLCLIEASGKEILNALEFGAKNVTNNYVLKFSEFGGFLHVSGLRYTIDTSIKSSVKTNNEGLLESIDGEYRVKDVSILIDGEYVLMDLNKTYTIATLDYLCINYGDGNTAFANSNILVKEACVDYEALIEYIKTLESLDNYKDIDNRIIIK